MRKIVMNNELDPETFQPKAPELKIRFEDGTIASLKVSTLTPENFIGLSMAEYALVLQCNSILNNAGMPSMTDEEALYFVGKTPQQKDPTVEDLTKLSGYTIEKTIKPFKSE